MPKGAGNLVKLCRAGGLIFEILDHQRGIPSKRKSAACVPALFTHRLPIEWFSENFGLELSCSAMSRSNCII